MEKLGKQMFYIAYILGIYLWWINVFKYNKTFGKKSVLNFIECALVLVVYFKSKKHINQTGTHLYLLALTIT